MATFITQLEIDYLFEFYFPFFKKFLEYSKN